MKLKGLFTDHPEKVGETYFEHFLFAAKASLITAKISCIMMLHAIFPFTCEHTASSELEKLNKIMQERKRECDE